MRRTAKDLLLLTSGFMFFVIVCIAAFQMLKVQLILFVPMALAMLLIGIIPPRLSVGVALGYMVFDGMLKILSGYNTVIHLGSDILVLTLAVRCLIEFAIAPADRRWVFPPFTAIFLVHLGWVTVQVLNPFGVSFLAGLAAYKVYMTFILLYFIAYLYLRSVEDLRALLWVAVIITALQVALSIYQFEHGEAGLLAFSRNYARPMEARFVGRLFRPFGTTAVPGGASTWVFLSLPLIIALFFDSKHVLKRLFLVILLGLAAYTLFICQVRSAVLKGLLGMMLVALVMFWRRPERLMGALGIVAALIYVTTFFLEIEDPRLMMAQGRLLSLTDIEIIQASRGTHQNSFLYLWNNAPFGIGLSRVGAAGAYFKSEIARDQFFGPNWSWTDNLYLTLAVELGFPGMIFFLCLTMGPFFVLAYRAVVAETDRSGTRLLIAGAVGLLGASIMGHLGSEGSLYLPESAYFWLFMGAAVRFSERLTPRQPEI
ncbi:MAG TPA: O-antigen ligase family protein [Bdellovibrionales bacterium]|nr:O-antigen ligase family protein [Bdellovibrionales bacterium]